MSNRRGRTRVKGKDYINNELMNKTIVWLVVIISIIIALITVAKIVQNKKVAEQKERIKQQRQEIFKATNEEFESLENYKSNSLIRISAVGDILCGNNLYQFGAPYDNIFGDIKHYLNNSDLTLGTYETDVYESKRDFAMSIKNAGIDLTSLAHNHALDYGKEGLDETNQYLNEIGVQTVGMSSDSAEKRVKIIEKKGAKIAIIAYTYDNDKEGVNIFSEELAKEDLAYANENSNFSIVMMHWGDVNKNETNLEQEEQAKFLIENGADIILGAHPSVVQRMEVVKNNNGDDCFVGYSLGDFTSDFESENANLELILNIQVVVNADGKASLYKVDYTPVYMTDKGEELKENRFKILDMKAEIEEYGSKENSVSEEIYNKLIRAVDRLNGIIIK